MDEWIFTYKDTSCALKQHEWHCMKLCRNGLFHLAKIMHCKAKKTRNTIVYAY